MTPEDSNALLARHHLGHAGAPLESARRVVVCLHGRGATAADILGIAGAIGLGDIAYLAPQARGGAWYPRPFMEPLDANEPDLSAALDRIAAILADLDAAGIGADKLVIAGFSQGACLSLEFAARHPGRVAAVLGFSGGLIGPSVEGRKETGRLDGLPVFTPAAAIRDLGQDSRGRLIDDLAGYFADIAIAAAGRPDRDAIVAAIAACGARLRTVVCDARAVLDRVYRTAGVCDDDLLAATIWGGQWQRRFTADRVQHIVATALSVALDTIAGRAGDDLSVTLIHLLERNGQARKCVVPDCEWWAVEQDRCSAHAIQRRRDRVLLDPSGFDSSTTATPRRSGHGWWGHLDDDGETIACHECGERFRALTRTHLETHDLTAREYKQRHGIEQRIGLVSTEIRERQQHQVATNPRYSERFRRNPNAPRLTDLPSALLDDRSR